MDLPEIFTALSAYSAAPIEWSIIWAVATACPMERATAVIIGFGDSFATTIAPKESFLASPTVTFSFSYL